VCRGSVCVEVIEYDYDLTEPDGNGTTQWSPPSGPPASIDRLRIELSEAASSASLAASPATVLVSGSLTLAKAR
jgi:hypothetical protein